MLHTPRLYGAGAIVLGLAGFAFGDFALQWQPVPAELPGRPVLAYLSAALLLGAGAALQFRRLQGRGAITLAGFYGLWVLALHLPNVAQALGSIGAWNAPAELTAMALGGFVLHFNAHSEPARARAMRLACILLGASAIVFGCAHFAYAEFTAGFVPAWLPPQLFWAYATGAGHVAAGVALVTGFMLRIAMPLYVLMLSSFALCVHLPRILARPAEHAEWLMLGACLSITGTVLIVWRCCVPAREPASPGHAAATIHG